MNSSFSPVSFHDKVPCSVPKSTMTGAETSKERTTPPRQVADSPKSRGSPKDGSSPAGLPTVEPTIEADDDANNPENDGDADSALGEDTATSTASITSSILQYRTILGRRFHSERGDALYWYVRGHR